MMPVKKFNSFYKYSTESEFRKGAETIGLSSEFILKNTVVMPEEACLLVVGSIAKGFGRPESDIDLFVLTEKACDVLRDKPTITFSSVGDAAPVSHKFFADGVEFDVEVHSMEGLSALEKSSAKLLRFLAGHHDKGGIPKFSMQEVQFLDLIKNGWLLHGDEYLEGVRGRLGVSYLSIYNSIQFYLDYLEFLEDCFSLRDDSKEIFATTVRICAQRGALSLLGLNGISDPSLKWTWKYLSKLADNPCIGDVVVSLRNLMFITLNDLKNDRTDVLKELQSIGTFIEKNIKRNPKMELITNLILSKVAYIFDQKAVDASSPER